MALPEIVSREQWLDARRRLLAGEKALTRRRDAIEQTIAFLRDGRFDASCANAHATA